MYNKYKELAQMDLPELKGSKKQIKWANDIRASFVFLECEKSVLDEILKITDSRFWIENRGLKHYELLKKYKKSLLPSSFKWAVFRGAKVILPNVQELPERENKWKKLILPGSLVGTKSEWSILIKMPYTSPYRHFVFWHPKKIARVEDGKLVISFTKEFEFKLKKYGSGKYNKCNVIKEVVIGAEEFVEIMETYAYCSTPLIHVPDKLEAEDVVIPEELLDE